MIGAAMVLVGGPGEGKLCPRREIWRHPVGSWSGHMDIANYRFRVIRTGDNEWAIGSTTVPVAEQAMAVLLGLPETDRQACLIERERS